MKLYDNDNNKYDYYDNIINGKTLPKYSSKIHVSIMTIIFIIIIGILTKLIHRESIVKTIWDIISIVAIFFIALSICNIIYHIGNLFIELLQTNFYHNNITNVQSLMIINVQFIFVLFFFIFFMFFYYSQLGNPIIQVWQHGPAVGFFGLAAAFFLSCMLNMNENKFTNDESIEAVEGIDYGRGMAYSYYYGYLKFILPSDGINNPGIRSKIEIYEANENVTVPVKKLFILIPESGYIPPDLSEASNYWLESTKSLLSEIRDRAGTKRRDYKNTVYKIHPNSYEQGHRPVYIVVEGATPMLTLYEILQHNHEQTVIYRRNKKKIVASFYETLTKLVSDPSCRNVVELVYYKDDDDNGNLINVAKILLDRIRQQAPQSF